MYHNYNNDNDYCCCCCYCYYYYYYYYCFFIIIAVCDLPCKFGKCVATNTCKCDTGYNGSQCDQDINECEISSPCKYIEDGLVTNVTKCHNTPGGYFCTCITGLQLSYDDSGNPKCNCTWYSILTVLYTAYYNVNVLITEDACMSNYM